MFLLSCASSGSKPKPVILDQPPPPPAVGQWFEYNHKGPRPWGDAAQDATGTRRVQVTAVEEDKKTRLWAFEETFAGSSDVQTSYFDAGYLLFRQHLQGPGGELGIEYSSPMPVRHLPLQPEKEEEFSSDQKIINPFDQSVFGTSKITLHTKRLTDERLVPPAGALLCRHFQTRVTLDSTLFGETITFTSQEETYWCDKIGWFVMEKQTFEPIIQNGEIVRPGYQTESLLQDYDQSP